MRLQTSRSMICRARVWWPSASVTAARSRRLISSYGAARRAAFDGFSGDGEVSCRQAVGGHDVRDVDDRTDQVVVEPVAAVHPGPAGGPELVEGLAGDQGERAAEVGDAVAAAGLAADPEPAEQVSVDEQALDLVDADAASLAGGGLAGVGQVQRPVRGLGPSQSRTIFHDLRALAGLMLNASATSSAVAPWGRVAR